MMSAMKTLYTVMVSTALVLVFYMYMHKKSAVQSDQPLNIPAALTSALKIADPCFNADSDAKYHIVLNDTLQKFPQYDYLSVWLSHDYNKNYWMPKFAEEQTAIDRIRAWSLTLSDSCFIKNYATWLDYYQHELDSAKDELRTQKEKKNMDEYDRQNKQLGTYVDNYSRTNPSPKPPL